MIPLLRKELRALAGIFVVSFIVISGDVVSRPASERIDENAWTSVSADLSGDGRTYAIILAILALVAAFAAYPREHDDRTIELLHSLPIRRSTIFAAKVAAGILVLGLATACGGFTNWLLLLPSTSSFLGAQWRLDLAVELWTLQWLVAVVAYAYGILISYFRRFGLVPLLLSTVILVQVESWLPQIEILDPSTLLVYSWDGQALSYPFGAAALQLGLAAAALLVALPLWMGGGERIAFALERARTDLRGRIAIGCGTTAVVATAIGVVFALVIGSHGLDPPDRGEIEMVSFSNAEASTEHFTFTYPTSTRHRAVRLIERSEELYAELREVAGMRSAPNAVVDLRDAGAGHLGLAGWTKVRIGLVQHRTDAELDRTFVHELTHVLQHIASDRRMVDEADAMGFFAEGSAELLALEVIGRRTEDFGTRAASRRIAAASWERHQIRFEDIIDHDEIRRRYDYRLEYALGETWAAALADLHGLPAVMKVFEALGRRGAPRDLPPDVLWRDTLQAAGYSVEAIRARWEGLLREIADAERDRIEEIPRLTGGVIERTNGGVRILVVLDRDPPRGSEVTVSIRSNAESPDSAVYDLPATQRADDPRRFEVFVPGGSGGSERFEYLPGIRPAGSHWAFHETWRSADR